MAVIINSIIINIIIEHINITVLVIGLIFSASLWWYSNKKQSRQLLNYLPNVWSSLGILGTFVSIVHAFKGDGVNWTDINQLIKNIVPAFETSIIGIIGAILSSIIAKIIYAKEDFRERDLFLGAYTKTPEELIGTINQQMTQLLTLTTKQHQELMEESLNQRSLAERIMTEFISNLQDFYNKLYEDENQHAQEMVDQYLAGINQLIMSTHGTIKDKFESLFTEHSDALKKLMENEEEKFIKLTNDITGVLNTGSQKIINTISDIGMNEIDSLSALTQIQKDQLDSIVKDNKTDLANIIKECKDGMGNITRDANLNLIKTAQEFTTLIESMKKSFEELTNGLPIAIEQIKSNLILAIQNITNEKFNSLSESHKVFVSGLLKQVEEFDKQVANQSKENQKDWSKTTNAYLSKLLNQVDTSVNNQVQLLQYTSQGLNSELTSILDSLKKATTNYKVINNQITTLVGALQKETNATEVYANSITSTNTQLTAIQKLLTDIANKNLQLRQELAQWKRTHKQVKVDTEKGTKECPNCKAENPIDAHYCRKCATSFWECEPICVSNKKKKEDSETQS